MIGAHFTPKIRKGDVRKKSGFVSSCGGKQGTFPIQRKSTSLKKLENQHKIPGMHVEMLLLKNYIKYVLKGVLKRHRHTSFKYFHREIVFGEKIKRCHNLKAFFFSLESNRTLQKSCFVGFLNIIWTLSTLGKCCLKILSRSILIVKWSSKEKQDWNWISALTASMLSLATLEVDKLLTRSKIMKFAISLQQQLIDF